MGAFKAQRTVSIIIVSIHAGSSVPSTSLRAYRGSDYLDSAKLAAATYLKAMQDRLLMAALPEQ